jgi:hypothetical protein
MLGALAVLTLLCADLLVGVLSNFGVSGGWLIVALAVAVASAAVIGPHRNKEWTIAELLFVVVVGAATWLAVSDIDLRHRLDHAKKQLAEARAKRSGAGPFDFVVYDTEQNPDPESFDSSPYRYAYERLDANDDPPPSGTQLATRVVGDHVKVTCRLSGTIGAAPTTWYRLVDGRFMSGQVVEEAPHSGQGAPPKCP